MMDARGLSCPLPVIMAQKAVQKNAPASLEILVDAQVAVENITRYARSQGYQVHVTTEGQDFAIALCRE